MTSSLTTSLTTLPAAIIARQSDQVLLAAAKTAFLQLQPGFDVSQGQFPHDLLAPLCILLAQAYIDLADIERRTSLFTATGTDLDRLGDLYGVVRGPAVYAFGNVTFSGTAGAIIPTGTIVATQGPNAQYFQTTVLATLPSNGTLSVPVLATTSGSAGNVGASTITQLIAPIPAGITSVTNPVAISGGSDLETDGPVGSYTVPGYRQDIQQFHNAHGEGGASKHLRKWARNVSGVGEVVCLTATPTDGWATIALIGTNAQPVSSTIAQAVEQYILDPWYLTNEAEAMTIGGFGGSLDTQSDGIPLGGSNNTVKFVHSGSGQGTLTQSRIDLILPQPGIWRMIPRMKVDTATGGSGVVQYGVWNVTNAAWAFTRPNNLGVAANQTLTGSQLPTSFQSGIIPYVASPFSSGIVPYQDFAWNGTDQLEARLFRVVADTARTLWVDEINYWATMSRADRDVGLSPAGMRLLVQPAGTVTVNVAATLSYNLQTGQTTASVQAAAAANITAYFASIAFQPQNAVRRAAVEDAIYQLTNGGGLADVNSVTINSSTNNILVPPTSVAVLGTQTWS